MNSARTPAGEGLRKTGIERIGDIPWGTHLCQFYDSEGDLLETLVPFFMAGLQGDEYCVWVTSDPLDPERARSAIEKAGGGRFLEKSQIEILPYTDCYMKGGAFDMQWVLDGWLERLERARAAGYAGLRVTGNTAWLEQWCWKDFMEYEATINRVITRGPMIVACTYGLDHCDAAEVVDVVATHAFAHVKRRGKWEVIENSERKRIAEELAASEARYRQLFENMSSAFAYHRTEMKGDRMVDYVFLEANGAFERQSGLRRADVVGRRATEIWPGLEQDPVDWLGRYGRVAATGQPTQFEHFFGTLGRWFSVLVYSPAPGHFATLSTDITDRKRAEAEREELLRRERAARVEAEALAQLRERFMAILGHDLRQPLSIIHLGAKMLAGAELDPKSRGVVERIDRSVVRVVAMVRDLLDYARIGAGGGIPLVRAPADLHEICARALEESRAAHPGRSIRLDAEGEVRGFWDAERLVQALCNLVANAVRHGAPGGPVTVSARPVGDRVEISVHNEGEPLPPDELPTLFEPFRRGAAARSPGSQDGLGLGLYIVREIVRVHGGEVGLRSERPAGTTFTMSLPRGEADCGGVVADRRL